MAQDVDETDLNTDLIKDWRSIVTLIVFVLTSESCASLIQTNLERPRKLWRSVTDLITDFNVLFPYHIPIYVPRVFVNAGLDALSALRIIPPRKERLQNGSRKKPSGERESAFRQFRFPMNFLTAPLVADLFLLAILAIGREEVYGGTIEANNIKPYDIMIFFISLAYIAISIDASGLIRWLAFKVLQKGGGAGHRLFLYLYSFFFVLGSFIGNDPIILSGTAFLAYMTRVSSNIVHPRAWIHTQFAIANIASAILVSSNPTNLVLAGAFEVPFLHYTANMIVPVVVTAIVLFPFLLYIIFNDEKFVPSTINIHELPEEVKAKKPVNPNIPNARGKAAEEENQHINDEQGQLLSLEEIMNPFLDKGGAAFGALIMAVTLITLIALNASGKEYPVFWVTLPGAFVMLVWDIGFGWVHRHETRKISHDGRKEVEEARADRARVEEEADHGAQQQHHNNTMAEHSQLIGSGVLGNHHIDVNHSPNLSIPNTEVDSTIDNEKEQLAQQGRPQKPQGLLLDETSGGDNSKTKSKLSAEDMTTEERMTQKDDSQSKQSPRTLTSWAADRYRWSQETFPTMTAVLAHLPFALIPFAFCMFTLVQALVTKGWIAVFAYGWDHWVAKTGTVGAVGGMGFLSVILCNVSTGVVLSRRPLQLFHVEMC